MTRRPWAIVGACLVLVAFALVRTAWMSDDAYITLRTVDNFVNGFGLRWNIAERVQSFTHPAWLLLITPFYAITHEAFYTVLALQIVLTLVTVALICRVLARSIAEAGLAIAALVASKAFIDFSTGGLENPLTHLLLVLLILEPRVFRPGAAGGKEADSLTRTGILTSLILLCRLDLGLLIGPMLAARLLPLSRRRVATFAVGMMPFLVWELFSLIYYGMLVPNTALAKLPAGVPVSALARQGVRYFGATFLFDPMTPILIAAGLIALRMYGGSSGRRVAVGVALYLVYLVAIGGDFMVGRFLTPALVMVVAGGLATWPEMRATRIQWAIAGAIMVGGLLNPAGPLRTGRDFSPTDSSEALRWGVVDERRVYYRDLGLLRVVRGDSDPARHSAAAFAVAARQIRSVIEANSVGIAGYYAGPTLHIIDRNALSDPLLSRLPPEPDWRIGHFLRQVPAGYFDSCLKNQNLIENPSIGDLYAAVRVVTRDPLFSLERLRAIWRLHMHRE